MNESWVGIDVSKDVLDVAFSDGRVLQVGNDEAGLEALRQELAGNVPALVLMEATGGG
jgi:transposase